MYPTEDGAPMQLPRRRFTFSANETGLPTLPGSEDLPDRPEACPPSHEVEGPYYFFKGGGGRVRRRARRRRCFLWGRRMPFLLGLQRFVRGRGRAFGYA